MPRLAVLLGFLVLAACGLKDDLYLPEPEKSATQPQADEDAKEDQNPGSN